ncbi:MAG TPA: DegT/DnrJ/EryC1/StrS family aminotransferase, partial [Candidatus Ozemobacteraceae bacterium]|nr:DegT/DnrJ/EryC1/StrS family aminotransferase [Candidatus Ozemobacteraceae bacterium]
ACSNYWLNVLLLDGECIGYRDKLIATTNEQKIGTRPAWTLIHHLPMYAACPRMETPIAEALAHRLINLPSSAKLCSK